MKFNWEKINEKYDDAYDDYWFATYRAQVFGGWLVRTFDYTKHKNENSKLMNGSSSEAMMFVPDPSHEWTIEPNEQAV